MSELPIPKSKKSTNLMGKLLSMIQYERWQAAEKVVVDLWKRNGLDNPTKRQNYTVREIKTVSKNGEEVTTYQLWHLVDQSVLVISPKVSASVQTGLKGDGSELHQDKTEDSTSSPI